MLWDEDTETVSADEWLRRAYMINRKRKEKEMNVNEIYNAAMLLGKTDKIRLVNKILASMAGKKERKDTPVMPVYNGLVVFSDTFHAKKGVAYTTSDFSGADFKNMRELLVKISGRLTEGGSQVVDETLLISSLSGFLNAVCTMKNQWYFDKRFTPYGLNHDFDSIYTELKSNNGNARQQQAYSYL